MNVVKIAAHAAHALLAGVLMIGFPIVAPWFLLAVFLLAKSLASPVPFGRGDVKAEAEDFEVKGQPVGLVLLIMGLAAPFGLLSPDLPVFSDINALAMRIGPLAAAAFIVKAAFTVKRLNADTPAYAVDEAYDA